MSQRQATAVEDRERTSVKNARYLMKYTGSLDRDGFEAKCREQPWWYHSYCFDNGFEVRGENPD